MATNFCKLLPLLLLTSFSIFAFAQTNYPKGKYVNIESLIKKQPVKEAFIIKQREEKEIKVHGGNDYDVWVCNEKYDENVLLRKAYAVSDCNTLYINGKKLKRDNRYCKVIQEGRRYLAFVVSIQKGDYSASLGALFGLVGGIVSTVLSADNDINRYPFVLDLTNNKNQPLTKELMYKNLLQYPVLLKQFEAEKNKNDVKMWLQYLMKMN